MATFVARSYLGLTDQVWKTLISVKLTLTLLVTLTFFSALGTLIAQQGTSQTPLEKLYSPQTLKWLVAFQLTDVFHSPYFIFLLLLLALNLISCSIERLPGVWRQAFKITPPPVSRDMLEEWTPEHARKQKFLVSKLGKCGFQTPREAKMAAKLFLEKNFAGKFSVLRDGGTEFQLLVERGKYSRLGVYITHLSLLMIMFGGAAGAIWGLEGGMSIEEGSRQSWIQHLKGSNGGMQLMRENGVPVPGFLNLGFEVECENFTLETYDGERPKAFRSKLNIYENDVKVASRTIAVNHPFEYKGITFYQASYTEVGAGGVDLKVYRPEKGAKEKTVELVENVRPGDLYRVDNDAAFRITRLEADMMNLGPAARVQYYRSKADKKPEEFWIFQKLPGFDFSHRKRAELNFVLDAVKPKYATGLSVARDPGVWIVWIGSAIMVIALFIALYTCHGRYWLTYNEDGFYAVGWSNKLFLFEPRFERFRDALRKELKA